MDLGSSITNALEQLKLQQDNIAALNVEIQNAIEDDNKKQELEEKLKKAKEDVSTTKEDIIKLMQADRTQLPTADKEPHLSESELITGDTQHDIKAPNPFGMDMLNQDHLPSRSFHFAPKLPVLQQYKQGENFLTWAARFKRFLKIGKITSDDSIIDLLLQNVDDPTVDKLEPVVQAMHPEERTNPELFIPLLEKAIYPEAEVRGWRQELSGGTISQGIDEDIDTYAAKIRSLAKKAYSNPSDRNEPCLNAFLNGLKDADVHNMIISQPGSDLDSDFEKAVAAARNFESRRRNRSQGVQPPTSPLDVLQVRNDSPRRSQQRNHAQDADTYQNNGRRRDFNQGRRGDNQRGGYNGGNQNARDRETRRCWYCNRIGHLRADCNTRRRDLNSERAGNQHRAGRENRSM